MDLEKVITFHLPIVEDSEHKYDVTCELDADGSPGSGVQFNIANHAHSRDTKEAIKREGLDIKEALSGFDVFYGEETG